jgi:hypothetical protein
MNVQTEEPKDDAYFGAIALESESTALPTESTLEDIEEDPYFGALNLEVSPNPR